MTRFAGFGHWILLAAILLAGLAGLAGGAGPASGQEETSEDHSSAAKRPGVLYLEDDLDKAAAVYFQSGGEFYILYAKTLDENDLRNDPDQTKSWKAAYTV
ncbi:MAG: hypothetical protein LBK52_00860, partial [Deltaproteobacteria bacterium]|nr:hypothetical protein [Deltaproteobacteria bacterium]